MAGLPATRYSLAENLNLPAVTKPSNRLIDTQREPQVVATRPTLNTEKMSRTAHRKKSQRQIYQATAAHAGPGGLHGIALTHQSGAVIRRSRCIRVRGRRSAGGIIQRSNDRRGIQYLGEELSFRPTWTIHYV